MVKRFTAVGRIISAQIGSYPLKHPYYRIGLDGYKRIDLQESLLFLLSLVDTIELTKKYSKFHGRSEEKHTEALYYFLLYCQKVNLRERISEEFTDYVAYILRSATDRRRCESLRNPHCGFLHSR